MFNIGTIRAGLLCIVAVILLYGCRTGQVKRVYHLFAGRDSVTLILEDSTFQYVKHDDIWGQHSSGTWTRKKGRIVLNSYRKDRLAVRCEERRGESAERKKAVVRVSFDVPDNKVNDYLCVVALINGDVNLNWGWKRGTASFESDAPVDSVSLRIVKAPSVYKGPGSMRNSPFVETEVVTPHTGLGDTLNVRVQVNDSLFHYKVFDNEEFRFRHGRVYIDYLQEIQ